jgi:hypothetical protein
MRGSVRLRVVNLALQWLDVKDMDGLGWDNFSVLDNH